MVIGITGKIGSGKSLALSYMRETYHAVCIIEDETAHEITRNDAEVIRGIVSYFGSSILDEEGRINRQMLRERIRRNPEDIRILNSLIHPKVLSAVTDMIRDLEASGHDLILVESALPKEACFDQFCDEIWVIESDTEIRRKRLMESRGMSAEAAQSMEKRQSFDPEDAKRPVRRISNNAGPDSLYTELDRAYASAVRNTEMTEDKE